VRESGFVCVRARWCGVCWRVIIKCVRPGRAVGVAICLYVSEGGSRMSGLTSMRVCERVREFVCMRERQRQREYF